MAHSVLTNAKVWVAQYDLSGDLNAVDVQVARPIKDDTCFGDTARIGLPGPREVALEMNGYADFGADAIDNVVMSRLGTANVPISVASVGTVGEPAYSFLSVTQSIKLLGEHGENAPFSFSAAGDGEYVRGRILANGTLTATGNGTVVTMPAAPASTDRLFAAIHCTAASGTSPTLNVIVQSGSSGAMAGATTRATFAQLTAAGSEFLNIAPVTTTHTFFRIVATIGGTNPSFTFAVVFGYKTV